MKNIYIIILFISIFSCKNIEGIGQQKNQVSAKATNYYLKAEEALFQRNTNEAIKQLEMAIKIAPNYIEANFKLATLYQNEKKYKEAINLFMHIKQLNEENFTVLYNIADCYFALQEYSVAEKNINEYLENEKLSSKGSLNGNQLKQNILFSKKAISNPVKVEYKNLGNAINTSEDEYFPSLISDNTKIYFTVKEVNNNFPNEDIYVSTKTGDTWSIRKKLGDNINTNFNEGAHCISPSGKYLLFASDNYKNGMQGKFDIFIAKKLGDDWLRAKNMGSLINSRYWDSQPVLSANSKELYFVSSKKGGFGGSDIYVSKLNEQGIFGAPENIGNKINTPFNEQRPFLHPDGKTLYFASSGHAGMGGIDLFKSTRNEKGEWSEPINLGYPINSSENEYGIFISTDGETAFISSNRIGGFGGQDIYSFELPQNLKPELVSYIKGKISDKESNESIKANIKIYDLDSNQLFNTLSSDKLNGQFLSTIVTKKNYAVVIEAEGYLPFSENISIKKMERHEAFNYEVKLDKIEIGKEFTLKNIFFNSNKYNLLEASKTELNYLIDYLKTNRNIQIEIGGHTDNIGSSEANKTLSNNRAKSVYEYLVKNGIDVERLSYKGFGDTRPMFENNSEQNRAKNRRTSFKIIAQ